MENIIIWGAGLNGLRLKRDLYKCTEEIKVCFFCDNNVKKQGCKLDGIEIISYEQVLRIYKEGGMGVLLYLRLNRRI